MILKETYNKGKKISNMKDVEILLSYMKDLDREHLVVTGLNAKNKVVYTETVAVGTLETVIIHAREIFKKAIIESVKAIILTHNHPSGDLEPSEEDIEIAKRVSKIGALLGINVLDQIVIAREGTVSLNEHI